MNTPKVGRTRKAKAAKAVEISFHADGASFDGGEAHAAINVKVHRHVPTTEQAWEAAVETFWENAWFVALRHGYSGVFSEGRSGGWLVPFYQYHNGEKLQQVRWFGQGPDKGYPTYPDMEDRKERNRFVRFRADILSLMENCIAQAIEDGKETA